MHADVTLLRRYLEPLAAGLGEPGVTELVVNQPGEFFVERAHTWTRHLAPELTETWLTTLASAAAALSAQDVDEARPICSTSLPGGERCQIVLPPAAAHVSLTIRRPADRTSSLDELSAQGFFGLRQGRDLAADRRDALRGVFAAGDWARFLKAAVLDRRNILIAGATGSGKTTLAKALGAEIPAHERLITIEDVAEFDLPHPNLVRLFYARGGQGVAQVGPKDLLESALRMRPDRVLLQELRDGAAYSYLRNIASGHPGAITTIHAGGIDQAFTQLNLLVKEAPEARGLNRIELERLLRTLVDVVVHVQRQGSGFQVTAVWHGER